MSAFYSENDPKAAAVLRELIAQGHIAPGNVDERSIEDVTPNELLAYTQVHLFAGYGIWSLAFRWAGIADSEPAWSCSCPCQPFSAAGKGEGFADERHLWPAAFHLISNAKRRDVPLYGEQVASSRVMPWIDLVWSDLEATGHTFRAVILASAGFGAPIIRQRTFWVASAERVGRQTGSDGESRHESGPALIEHRSEFVRLVCPFQSRLEGHSGDVDGGNESGRDIAIPVGSTTKASDVGGLAEPYLQPGRPEHEQKSRERSDEESGYSAGLGASSETFGLAGAASVGRERGRAGEEIPAPGTIKRLERLERLCDASRLAITNGRESSDGKIQRSGKYGLIAKDCGVAELFRMGVPERTGRQPIENESGGYGERSEAGGEGVEFGNSVLHSDEPRRPGPTNGHWRDADWLRCRDALWRPVESGTFPLAHGDTERVGRLRGYGNAISPQVAAEFIKAHREAEGLA